jgi:hypothetical protein
MDNISYIHKSVELLFQILGLVEVWSCPAVSAYFICSIKLKLLSIFKNQPSRVENSEPQMA